jgi:hypothetical protein
MNTDIKLFLINQLKGNKLISYNKIQKLMIIICLRLSKTIMIS